MEILKKITDTLYDGDEFAMPGLVEAAIKHKADIVACSILLTTTMPETPKVVKAFVDAGIREQIKIMIGGAPITQDFCERMGCDGYAKDAGAAAAMAVAICQK